MKNNNVCPLKGYKVFDKVFQSGKKLYSGSAASVICFDFSADYDGNVHLGVTISKRLAKKAVIRNRIKRLLRESVRLAIKQLNQRGTIIPIDQMIISWRQAPDMPSKIRLADVMPHVIKIIQSAESIYNRKKAAGNETTDDNADKSI